MGNASLSLTAGGVTVLCPLAAEFSQTVYPLLSTVSTQEIILTGM